MSKDEVSRRCVLGALGVGAAGAAAVGVAAADVPLIVGESATRHSSTSEPNESASEPAVGAGDICAPLVAGSALGRWTIEALLPVEGGAASVVLSDANGERFQVDICARDEAPDACQGPGRTDRFELFLANRGDGSTNTFEDHGLAAMALAEVVRANEHGVDRSAFQTLRQRIEAKRVRLHVT